MLHNVNVQQCTSITKLTPTLARYLAASPDSHNMPQNDIEICTIYRPWCVRPTLSGLACVLGDFETRSERVKRDHAWFRLVIGPHSRQCARLDEGVCVGSAALHVAKPLAGGIRPDTALSVMFGHQKPSRYELMLLAVNIMQSTRLMALYKKCHLMYATRGQVRWLLYDSFAVHKGRYREQGCSQRK